MKNFLFLIIANVMISSAFALEASPFAMVGYGSYNKKAGAEISLGMQVRAWERLKLDIAPLTGIFKRKDDPRYTRERDDDKKQIVCKDNSNGQYVDSKHCGINFKYAFESSLKVQPFSFLEIGAGARVADRTLAYGVAVIKFSDHFGIEGKFGDDYNSALLRIDF